MNKLVKEELEAMKYLLGYQRGKVISEQAQVTSVAPVATPAAAPQTVEQVVKKIQEVLNTKYGAKLTVDGKWGNNTQTAFEAALKTKASAPKAAPTTPAAPVASGTTTQTTTTPAASGTTVAQIPSVVPNQPLSVMPPTVPGVSYQTPTAPQSTETDGEKPEDIVGAEVAQPTRRDMRRDRQDLRRSNRRAMQDLRAQQRAQ